MQLLDPHRTDSLAQRAMRVIGLVAFVAFLVAGPVTTWLLPAVKTRASVPMPAVDGEAIRLGRWMKDCERHLQESSPLVYELRGIYNEQRYRLGILENRDVAFGVPPWFFFRRSLDVDPGVLARVAPARKTSLTTLKQRLDRLGVAMFVVVVPDKPRIYPEFAYPDGRMSEAKAALYGQIRAELAAVGLPSLDALSILQARKQALVSLPAPAGKPDGKSDGTRPTHLYYQRDTHWNAEAAIEVAKAVKPRLVELGLDRRLGPPVAFELMPLGHIKRVPDLVGMLGLRGDVPDDTPARSPVVEALRETTDHVFLWLKGENGAPNRPYASAMADAAVALCGTSYSEHNFSWALAWYLGCMVDFRGAFGGAGPFRGLRETLDRIERGEAKARLIVWEFPEYTFLDEWRYPPRFD